jgi:hypothetical protein
MKDDSRLSAGKFHIRKKLCQMLGYYEAPPWKTSILYPSPWSRALATLGMRVVLAEYFYLRAGGGMLPESRQKQLSFKKSNLYGHSTLTWQYKFSCTLKIYPNRLKKGFFS